MREESRTLILFGIFDLSLASSESENDLGLDVSSCDSGADGSPCHQQRKDSSNNG